jgi:ribosomal protein L14
VYKKLQLYPKLGDRYMPQNPTTAGACQQIQPATTYAQAVKQQTNTQHNLSPHTQPTSTPTPQKITTHPPHDLSELQSMMNIMDQMCTLINLISMLVSKPTAKPLRISVWNANGLCKHTQEIIQFLQIFDIDILLISETHFTSRSYIKVPSNIVYKTQHPDETAHGGAAIIIRQKVKHIREEYKQVLIQATSIVLQDDTGELNIAAVYSPPKHVSKEVDYTRVFHTLGQIPSGRRLQCKTCDVGRKNHNNQRKGAL